jgi:hypothetical protein
MLALLKKESRAEEIEQAQQQRKQAEISLNQAGLMLKGTKTSMLGEV